MADFKTAFDRTLAYEGGYSLDPFDFGGETIFGIARKYHPDWMGWSIVDYYKSINAPKKTIETDPDLLEDISGFYREHYWNPILGTEIASQAVANELFDCAVNMGIGRAIIILQKALNALNRDQTDYPDLSEDGGIGPVTMSALNICLKKDEKYLLKAMAILRGAYYLDIMKGNKTQERFARGWLSRVLIQ